MIKISIIIPIYNAEKHLQECLNSITAQEFQDFEVLMVNDGSTDKSLEIMDSYAGKDERFKIINQTNNGVSSARNRGITESKGNCICFVDADDKLANDFLSSTYQKADQYDLVVTGAQYTDCYDHKDILPQGEYNVGNIGNLLANHLKSICFNAVWGKLFRRDIIITNNITFDKNLKYGEDAPFCQTYLANCTSIYIDGDCKYIYRFEHAGFDHLKKFKMPAEQCAYHISNIAKAYYAICGKFTFTNNDYLQTMTRLRLLCYDTLAEQRYKSHDIALLFSLKEVKECFYLRRNYSRFNLLQYWLIKLHLYSICSFLCNKVKKIIV